MGAVNVWPFQNETVVRQSHDLAPGDGWRESGGVCFPLVVELNGLIFQVRKI